MTLLDTSHIFTFDIADTDVSAYVLKNSLRFVDAAGGEVDTLSFELEDWTDALDLLAWQEVKVHTVSSSEWSAYNSGGFGDLNYGGFAFGGYVVQAKPAIAPTQAGQRWVVQCESYTTLCSRTPKIRKTYANSTIGAIVADLFTLAGLTQFNVSLHVEDGPTLALFATDGEDLATALDRLAQLATEQDAQIWSWRIEADQNVWFGPIVLDPAPFSIADLTTANWTTSFPPLETPTKDIDAREIRNRVTVRGGSQASEDTTDNFVGDGATTIFTLTYRPVRDIVSIKLATVVQSYGVDWYDTWGGGYNCLVNYAAGTVRFPDATPPAYGAALEVVYRYDVPIIVTISDTASYAQYGLWFDFEIDDPTISNLQLATDIANMILDEYAFGIVTGTLVVERMGIRAGQVLQIELPLLDLTGNYIVRNVTSEFAPGHDGFRSTITFGGRSDTLSSAVGGSSTVGGGSVGGGAAGGTPAMAQPTIPANEGNVGKLRVVDKSTGLEMARLGDLSDISGCSGWGLWTENGYFTGKVTATTGTIGGFAIGTHTLEDSAGVVGLSSAVTGGDDIRIWAGHATPTSAPFYVTEAGHLYASDATITGAGVTTFRQDAVPTAVNAGDIWYDTDDGNKMYRATAAGDDEAKAGEWEYVGGVVSAIGALSIAPAPSGDGLYLGSTYMGYYSSGWKTYLDNIGNFYLGGSTGPLTWTASTSTLTVGKWNINSTSIYTGTEDHSGYTGAAGDITFYSDGSDASIHAYNCYIDTVGALTAKAGTIGGWTIGTDKLSTGSGVAEIGMRNAAGYTMFYVGDDSSAGIGYEGVQIGIEFVSLGDRAAFYVGDGSTQFVQFRYNSGYHFSFSGTNASLTEAGLLTASNVIVTGTVNATGGYVGASTAIGFEVGGLNVGATGHVRGGKANYSDATAGFFLGYESSAYKFVIGATDYLRWTGAALQAQFGGSNAVTLDADGLTIGVATVGSGHPLQSVKFKSGATEISAWRVFDFGSWSISNIYHVHGTLPVAMTISAAGVGASSLSLYSDSINLNGRADGDHDASVSVDGSLGVYTGFAVNISKGNYDTYIYTDSDYEALFVDASNDSIDIMHHASGKVGVFAVTPVVRQNHIADPSGGATVDAEARTAINSILTALETYGWLKTS